MKIIKERKMWRAMVANILNRYVTLSKMLFDFINTKVHSIQDLRAARGRGLQNARGGQRKLRL